MAPRKDRGRRFDAFLSHRAGDRAEVERLAARLQDEAGLEPFLDTWHLVPGEPMQEGLEGALDDSATCVVFLGPDGLGPWENELMRSALDDRVGTPSFRVIPVLLPGADPKDPATLPRFLRRLTWVDFRAGLDDPDAFRRLVAGIEGRAPGRGILDAVQARNPARAIRELGAFGRRYALLFLPTLLALGLAAVTTNWRVATRVAMDLTVERAVFTLGEGAPFASLLGAVDFRSLTVEGFDRIGFSPVELEVADPDRYLLAEDDFPDAAWADQPFDRAEPVVFEAGDASLRPSVTFVGARRGDPEAGRLTGLRAARGSRVTLGVGGGDGDGLTVAIDEQDSAAVVSFRQPFELISGYAKLRGGRDAAPPVFDGDVLTFRARLPDLARQVEITSRARSLVLVIDPSPGAEPDLLPEGGFPVVALEFTRQKSDGDLATTLLSAGTLSYPDFPAVEPRRIEAHELIDLGRLEGFRVEAIDTVALTGATTGLRFRLDGRAGHIGSGSREQSEDHRLTVFDTLWNGSRALVFLGIAAWLVSTTAGAFRLWSDLRFAS